MDCSKAGEVKRADCKQDAACKATSLSRQPNVFPASQSIINYGIY